MKACHVSVAVQEYDFSLKNYVQEVSLLCHYDVIDTFSDFEEEKSWVFFGK